MRRVAVTTGIELAVHEQGTGTPVVLLHAWGETHRTFDRLVPLLPDSMHLVLPDQRGVGASAKPTSGYSLPEGAADVVALLDALGVDACWVVGTSSGGYLAQQIALDHPARVHGLVLIGSPRTLRLSLPATFVDLLSSSDPVSREGLAALGGAIPLHGPVPQSFVEEQRKAALSIPSHVWRRTLEGLVEAVPPTELGAIEVPTLILWGGAEDILPAEQGHELEAAIHGKPTRHV